MHGANALVGGTGLVYAAMRYLAEPDDPFAVVNHPLQPLFQHLHLLCAPILVFVAGFLWQRHVLGRLTSEGSKGRGSGWALILTLIPMVLSGYLIQTATEDTWRSIWIGVHLATSAAWLAGYGAHLVSRRARGAVQVVDLPSSTRG